jgi:hypothetical protein
VIDSLRTTPQHNTSLDVRWGKRREEEEREGERRRAETYGDGRASHIRRLAFAKVQQTQTQTHQTRRRILQIRLRAIQKRLCTKQFQRSVTATSLKEDIGQRERGREWWDGGRREDADLNHRAAEVVVGGAAENETERQTRE